MLTLPLSIHTACVCHIDIGSSLVQTVPMATEAQVDAFYRALGERVRRERKRAEMSQAELAQRLGLTRASIANLEAGRQRPAAHQAATLAKVLEVPIQDLLPAAPAAVDVVQEARDELRARARYWAGASS